MEFASANLSVGQLNALVKTLGGEKNVMAILRGELVAVVRQPNAFPIWKTQRLGVCKTADEYREALEKAKRPGDDWVRDILSNPAFVCAAEETDLELVAPSAADLGFKDGAYDSQIREKALEMGLKLCPIETLPALRLADEVRTRAERVIIAIEAITDAGGELDGLDVELGRDGLQLRGHCSPIDRFRDPGLRFVFARPTKS